MSSIVRMRLLGSFALERDGTPLPVASPRLKLLLAYLALHREEPQRRQSLAFLLWPDSSETQAQTNLRTLVSRLHTVVPNLDRVLRIDARSVAWDPASILELDVAAFEEALRHAETGSSSSDDDAVRAALEQAVTAYAGDLLPDCSDEWVEAERERLRLLLLRALEQLVAVLERRREYAAALVHARRMVQVDRLNEAAYATLMRLHSLTGSRASAIRVYHAAVSALETELGMAPRRALTAAYERLLASETPRHSAKPTGGARSTSPLVGRHREWQRVVSAWQIAAAGQPRLMVVSGEAGTGKTRLATELLDWCGRQGILTAASQCYATEGDLAYAPVINWLRGDALRPNLERLDPGYLGDIAILAPELVPQRSIVRTSGPLAETWRRQRLFEALARAVLPRGRPILLFIDDLQWCPRDTLEWLHFLVRFDSRGRLLILGTVRPEEVLPDHPLANLLNVLRREGRLVEIALGRLNRDETVELARHVADRSLDPAETKHLFAETEGNPLFIVETVQARLAGTADGMERPLGDASTDADDRGVDLPPGVRAVIARRLAQVTPPARTLLAAAAVIGRSFTVALLARVARVDEDALLGALDELWQRRIVQEHGADAYDFSHDKLRAVAYANLSMARRRALHRQVAAALEAEHGADLDPVAGLLAFHYERAGLPTRAIASHHRAARVAHRLGSNAMAVASFQRALVLAGPHPTPETVLLHDELGEVLHLLGRYDEAQAAWQHALQLTPDGDRVARAHLYRKLGNASRDQYHYDEALATYDAAEAALGSCEDVASEAWWLCRAQIKLERISIGYWLGRISDILTFVDQVREVLEKYGSASDRVRLYQATTMSLLRRDRYAITPETLDLARRHVGAVEEADDPSLRPAARFLYGFVSLWADNLDEAEREIASALTLAERAGDISLEGRCLTYLTVIARKRQHVERAREYAERSLRVARTGPMPDYVGAAHGNLAWVAWRLRDYRCASEHGQAALRAWEQLTASYPFEWIGRWPLTGLALGRKNLSVALDHARVLLDPRQQLPRPAIEAALLASLRAADLGDLASARTHLEAAAESARQDGDL